MVMAKSLTVVNLANTPNKIIAPRTISATATVIDNSNA